MIVPAPVTVICGRIAATATTASSAAMSRAMRFVSFAGVSLA